MPESPTSRGGGGQNGVVTLAPGVREVKGRIDNL